MSLRRRTLLIFALPATMQGFMHAPEFQVQGIYAKYAGLSLTAIAGAMLLTRVFDAITYPLIGKWSDAGFRRFGTRKPWIAVGTLVTVAGLWFLYRPPPQPSIEYYAAWTLVTYIGWKLTEIPYGAWSLTLSSDYVERTKVQLWRGMGLLAGGILFFGVPLAAKALGLNDTTALNLKTLSLTAMVILVCVPLINGFALSRVPEGAALPPPTQSDGTSWRALWRAMAGNGPLLRVLAAAVPIVFFQGMATGTSFLYVDTYMHLGKQLPLIQIISLPMALLGLPFWGWMCQKYERHRVWGVSLSIAALSYGTLGCLPVGEGGLYVILVLYPITLLCFSCLVIALPAILGDIVDYDRLRTGEDRSGIYSAILAFLGKSLLSVTAALGLAVTGWLGFDATAAEQTFWGGFGIRLTSMWLPALGFAMSVPLIWWFPLNRARQAEIREALLRQGSSVAIASASPA